MTKQEYVAKFKEVRDLKVKTQEDLALLRVKHQEALKPLRDEVEALLTERMSENLKNRSKMIEVELGNDFQRYLIEIAFVNEKGERQFGFHESIRYENTKYTSAAVGSDKKYTLMMSYGSLGSFTCEDKERIAWLEFLSITASSLSELEVLIRKYGAETLDALVKEESKLSEVLSDAKWEMEDLMHQMELDQLKTLVTSGTPIVFDNVINFTERAGGNRGVIKINALVEMPSGDYKVLTDRTHFYVKRSDLLRGLRLGHKVETLEEVMRNDSN